MLYVVCYLYVFHVLFGRAMAVSSRPLNSDARVRSQLVPSVVVDTVALWQVFLQVPLFPLWVSFHHCSILKFICMLLLREGQVGEDWEPPQKNECSSGKWEDLIRKILPDVSVVTIQPDKVCFANLMFIGPCIIAIVDEWKTNLMSLAILFHLLCAQHVSDINIFIFRSLRLCWWITTSVVLFSVRCVLQLWCGWF